VDKVPEFCLAWIDHWSTCMTKVEWGSWAQVLITAAAVSIAYWAVVKPLRHMRVEGRRQEMKARLDHIEALSALTGRALAVGNALSHLHERHPNFLLSYRQFAYTRDKDELANLVSLMRALDGVATIKAGQSNRVGQVIAALGTLNTYLDTVAKADRPEDLVPPYYSGNAQFAINTLKSADDFVGVELELLRIEYQKRFGEQDA
jgi:hypothetical protein